MTGANQYPDSVPEETLRRSREVYVMIAEIANAAPVGTDGAGNAHKTAFKNIGEVSLARLYLLGAADALSTAWAQTPGLHKSGEQRVPLDVIMETMLKMAELDELGDLSPAARTRVEASMDPWLIAQSQIAAEYGLDH